MVASVFNDIMLAQPFREPLELPNRIYYAFIKKFHEPGKVTPHYHDCLELIVPLGIHGTTFISGQPFSLVQDHIYCIAPEAVHSFVIRPGRSVNVLVVQINMLPFYEACSGFTGSGSRESVQELVSRSRVVSGARAASMYQALSGLSLLNPDHSPEEPAVKTPLQDMQRLYAVFEFMADLESPQSPDPEASTLLHRIIDAIGAMIYSDISLDRIAYKSGLSKFHLCRIFKAHTGMTVQTYINELRIRQACRLLRAGTHNVTQTCFACGFNSLSYFIQVFKSKTGHTPKKWLLQSVTIPQ